MLRKILTKSAITLAVVSVSACSSIDCPIDTPQCCYNVLFGCSIWDLPSGCTCADYGFGFTNPAAASQASMAPATPARRLHGAWTGSMSKYRNSCPGAVPSLNGIVSIDEAKGTVRINIPGYGTVKGQTRGRYHFAASGTYVDADSGCAAAVNVVGVSSRLGLGRIYSRADITCGSHLRCSASYSGNMVRR